MAVNCPGCGLSVEPIREFDRSKKTGKPYLLVRCPRERCGFYIDIEDWTGKRSTHPEKPGDGDDGRSFWRYGL